MKRQALVAVLVVTGAVAAAVPTAATGSATGQSSAYAGTHVTFDASSDAVVGYTVDGETVVESVAVQSESAARNGGVVGVGADLSSVTDLGGAAVSVGATAETRATVEADSGATLTAHDSDRGVLVVRANGEGHYVQANLSSGASAERAGERRVVVENARATGAFVVVGDGEVTVNDAGNVTARLGEDAKLVYRQYDGARSASEKRQEGLIANGTAAAEVYVTAAGEGGGDLAADVVQYGEDTTVEVTQRSESTVEMTVERSRSRGKVVIASVPGQTYESAEDVSVTVDGEAAARAESYGDVVAATDGGETSTFLVRQSGGARASTDVVVGVNHFSTRTVTVTDGDTAGTGTADGTDDGTGDGTDGGTATDGGSTGGDGSDGGVSTTAGAGPGFGVVAGLAAMAAALLAARRR